jgi:hypothetical protein
MVLTFEVTGLPEAGPVDRQVRPPAEVHIHWAAGIA